MMDAKQNLSSKFKWVRCDLCGRDNAERILEAKDLYNKIPGTFSVVRCKNCSFVYTNPRPYGEELAKYYPDDSGYFRPAIAKEKARQLTFLKKKLRNKVLAAYLGYSHLSNINRLEKVSFLPLFLLLKRMMETNGIPPFVQNGKMLEIGCSYGLYLKHMRELGWEVVGIEPNRKAADFGQKEFRLRIINASLENVNITEKFDVIAMRMVLEHLPSPSQALEKASKLLEEGGRLIIIVPDFSGIEFRLFKEYCYALQVPTHLNHFTTLTLRQYLKKSGFKVEKIIHHRIDRDFVASAKYMKDKGRSRWLAPILSNRPVRRTILKAVVILLSYLGKTSRMSVWVRKNESRNKIRQI
ncbi:class I SAM-dependent methyltransferase [bacterium]|nr:class I SAM-dependent methyltransferase [bacterium]